MTPTQTNSPVHAEELKNSNAVQASDITPRRNLVPGLLNSAPKDAFVRLGPVIPLAPIQESAEDWLMMEADRLGADGFYIEPSVYKTSEKSPTYNQSRNAPYSLSSNCSSASGSSAASCAAGNLAIVGLNALIKAGMPKKNAPADAHTKPDKEDFPVIAFMSEARAPKEAIHSFNWPLDPSLSLKIQKAENFQAQLLTMENALMTSTLTASEYVNLRTAFLKFAANRTPKESINNKQSTTRRNLIPALLGAPPKEEFVRLGPVVLLVPIQGSTEEWLAIEADRLNADGFFIESSITEGATSSGSRLKEIKDVERESTNPADLRTQAGQNAAVSNAYAQAHPEQSALSGVISALLNASWSNIDRPAQKGTESSGLIAFMRKNREPKKALQSFNWPLDPSLSLEIQKASSFQEQLLLLEKAYKETQLTAHEYVRIRNEFLKFVKE